jgi:hypothetical protein
MPTSRFTFLLQVLRTVGATDLRPRQAMRYEALAAASQLFEHLIARVSQS